jgi:hypothetical protein
MKMHEKGTKTKEKEEDELVVTVTTGVVCSIKLVPSVV